MQRNIDEKLLIKIEENSIFSKIKKFFSNIFSKKQKNIKNVGNIAETDNISKSSNEFLEYVQTIENDETKLLKLQKQFEDGKIDIKQLSTEQIKILKKLYNDQISNLEKSNENRRKKILQHKSGEDFLKRITTIENKDTKLLKLQKQYENNEIQTNQLSPKQMYLLINLYKTQIINLSRSNEIKKQKLLKYRKNMQNI